MLSLWRIYKYTSAATIRARMMASTIAAMMIPGRTEKQYTMITIYYKSSTVIFGSRVGRRGGYGNRFYYYVSTAFLASNDLE